LNHDRMAVQVEGCGGSLVAHLPLTMLQLAELTDDVQRVGSATDR
jgi:hypothetical protein